MRSWLRNTTRSVARGRRTSMWSSFGSEYGYRLLRSTAITYFRNCEIFYDPITSLRSPLRSPPLVLLASAT